MGDREVKVFVDWGMARMALNMRFPDDADYDLSGEVAVEVPVAVAERWQEARDAWLAIVSEVRACQAAQSRPGSVNQ